MSKMKLNGVFFKEMHGAHGDAIVKMMFGRVFTAEMPKQSNKAPSGAQVQMRQRFKEANGYATAALRNAAGRAFYEQVAKSRNTSPLAQAMGDFLLPPNVDALDLTAYHGKVGDLVKVSASDDTGVVSVTIQIRSATNAVIEEGPATLLDQAWAYTGQTALTVGQPVTIKATAKDRPGNTAEMEKPFTRNA